MSLIDGHDASSHRSKPCTWWNAWQCLYQFHPFTNLTSISRCKSGWWHRVLFMLLSQRVHWALIMCWWNVGQYLYWHSIPYKFDKHFQMQEWMTTDGAFPTAVTEGALIINHAWLQQKRVVLIMMHLQSQQNWMVQMLVLCSQLRQQSQQNQEGMDQLCG